MKDFNTIECELCGLLIMNSKTPKTDAAEIVRARINSPPNSGADTGSAGFEKIVTTEFARTLELECQELKLRAEQAEKECANANKGARINALVNKSLSEKLSLSEAKVCELMDALKSSIDAISSLPVECLGGRTAENGMQWSIRDELLHKLYKALSSTNPPYVHKEKVRPIVEALRTAINTVECASIYIATGEELPWYKQAKSAITLAKELGLDE